MKAIKYFVAGAMLSISATAMAQSATVQAQIDEITKTVVEAKGDVKATKDAVKLFMKSYKKDADALAGLGRAFMKAGNMAEAQRYAVEEFVGQLPPYTRFNNFVYRISQLGLTAVENNHAK